MPTCLLSPLHRFSAYKLLKLKLLSRAYHNKEIALEIAFYFSMIENVNAFMNHLLQGTAKRQAPDLANSVPALAYHFSLTVPAAFT